jgi:glycosyltransferase involved in cell wall biosynthesis
MPNAKKISESFEAAIPTRRTQRVRLAYLVSHPIQYQAPLLRRIAQEPDIELTVFFGSDFSVRSYEDKGFGVAVEWDVPLLEGYRYEFLPAYRDTGDAKVFSPISKGILQRLAGEGDKPGFDVLWVHGYSTVNTLQAMVWAKLQGIPVLLRAESWLHDRVRGAMKLAAKKVFFMLLRGMVDATLAIGTHNRQYWEHYLGSEFPIFSMPYSVDNAYFQTRSLEATPERETLRAELGFEPGRPIILFASKLQTRKHCADLIEAYALLSPAAGQEPLSYLAIVGDGEERAALEAQAARTGFGSIRFCGFRNQSELPRFFDLCSVFVLPSRYEPWGLIVNEAMNAARAVIVTDDVGSAIDLIADGVEGFVYPVRDVPALADALRKVLGSPETAEAMGRNALRRIDTWNFDADVVGLRQAIAHVSRNFDAELPPEHKGQTAFRRTSE